MCTAATYTTDSFYFGRNLDYEFSYGDEVTVTPRAYPFSLRCMGDFRTKYAMIGMAYVAGEYPLYYDAVNEKGLGIAGLNFVGNAVYHPAQDGKSNVAQFELIPWLLGSCATLAEVRTLLAKPTSSISRSVSSCPSRSCTGSLPTKRGASWWSPPPTAYTSTITPSVY